MSAIAGFVLGMCFSGLSIGGLVYAFRAWIAASYAKDAKAFLRGIHSVTPGLIHEACGCPYVPAPLGQLYACLECAAWSRGSDSLVVPPLPPS